MAYIKKVMGPMVALPTEHQIAVAVAAMQRAHAAAGYRKPLKHAEHLAWAVVCAIILEGPPVGFTDAIADEQCSTSPKD